MERLVRRCNDYHAHITHGPLCEDYVMTLGKERQRGY